MNLFAVGLSHKTTPVELRERFYLKPEGVEKALPKSLETCLAGEAMLVSTCNRTELYLTREDRKGLTTDALRFFAQMGNVSEDAIRDCLYVREGDEAISHLFRVVSSLDSLVVGEPQITGQIKDAMTIAQQAGTLHGLLNKVANRSLSVVKRVRTETGIARNAVSISFAAVELARKIFGDLSALTVAVIGTGEMSTLTLRHLVGNGLSKVVVVSRTEERASEVAVEFNAVPMKWSDFLASLHQVDIVISSTASPVPILKKEHVAPAVSKRRGNPLFLIDIAVPRDIDNQVNDVDNVFLYNIDDLSRVVESNLKERAKEAEKAERIVAAEVLEFKKWMEGQELAPVIGALHQRCESIRTAEIEKSFQRLQHLSEEDRSRIEDLTSAIVKKILHSPIQAMKIHSSNGIDLVNAARLLFQIEESQAEPSKNGHQGEPSKRNGNGPKLDESEEQTGQGQPRQRLPGNDARKPEVDILG